MLKSWVGCAVITVVLGAQVPGAIAASDQSTPEHIGADQALDQLDFFAKDWQCESQKIADSLEPETNTFQWSMNRELNNLWFIGQAIAPDGEIFERETLGYNTIMGKFGRTIIGNDGKFANFLSAGWDEQTFTWEGRVVNMVTRKVTKQRIVVTKTAEHAFESVDYVSMPETPDQWKSVAKINCVCEQAVNPAE